MYVWGYMFAMLGIIMKLWRIKILLKSKRMKTSFVRTNMILTQFAFLMILETVLILVWIFVFPIDWVRTAQYFDLDGFVLESIGSCHADQNSGVFLGLIFGTYGIVLILTAWIGYEVRNLPIKYQESTAMFFSILITILLYVIGIPAVASVYGNVQARFLVISTIIFVNSLVFLGCMFIPKIRSRYLSLSTSQAALDAEKKKKMKKSTENSPVKSKEKSTRKMERSVPVDYEVAFRMKLNDALNNDMEQKMDLDKLSKLSELTNYEGLDANAFAETNDEVRSTWNALGVEKQKQAVESFLKFVKVVEDSNTEEVKADKNGDTTREPLLNGEGGGNYNSYEGDAAIQNV